MDKNNRKMENLDELLDKTLAVEQELPEGLSERLEKQIDTWAKAERQQKRLFTRRWIYWVSGIAATILLTIGIFRYDAYEKEQKTNARELADATITAQNALQLFFNNFNKGIMQIDNVNRKVDKVNELLIEKLNY